ncbi:LOW QUALITY PROTEIN: age-related maculopathy susceptibility protein 2 [Macaca mulatta]
MWSSLSYVADPQKAVTDGAYKGRREAHTLSSEAGEDEFEVLEEHGVTPGRSWAMLGEELREEPQIQGEYVQGIAPLSPRHVSVLYVLHLHPGPTVTEVEGKGGPEMASLSSSVVPVSFISTRESLLDTGVGGEGASDRQRSKLSLSHSKIPAAKIHPELYLPAFFSLAGTSSVLDQQP